MKYFLAIIGGGPAGYTVAMMLAKKGFSTVLFEKDKLFITILYSTIFVNGLTTYHPYAILRLRVSLRRLCWRCTARLMIGSIF